MKIKFLICMLVVLLAAPLLAAPPGGKSAPPKAQSIDNTTYIDANLILMFVTNHGNFGRDLSGVFGYDYGTFYPFSGTQNILDGSNVKSPYYAGGLWVGAVDSATNEKRVVVSEYSSEYGPGPADAVNHTFFPDKGAYKVYKLFRDSMEANPNYDYLNWPVNQGAPVDSLGKPALIGDQMCWSVYNDFNPARHTNDAGKTLPLGLEVRQTIFAFDRQGSLGNIIFLRFQIFNKGERVLKPCFISLWSDPDLGGAGDDLVGCDTTIDLGYVYNSTNTDQLYGGSPPSLGMDFFQGPLIETGELTDTARMWGQLWPGFKNMGLYSFNKYINGTDPRGADQSYNYMQGLERSGTPYMYNGNVLRFMASGDPVAGTGDLDDAANDRRWEQTTGPIDFRPGDSTEILAAMVIGQGSDRLTSITVMKEVDKFAQRVYEKGFNPPRPPAKPKVVVARTAREITLSWGDTSQVDPGDYFFEGYSVWQGETSAGPWKLLATYDVKNNIDSLTDIFFDVESGLFLPRSLRALKNLGLKYFYTTEQDAISGQPLRSVNDYYFRVTAFSYTFDTTRAGEAVPKGDRFLESQTPIVIRPQDALAGEKSEHQTADVISAQHPTGVSGGRVLPIVKDPFALTGHQYRVTFQDTVAIRIDTIWNPAFPNDIGEATFDSTNIAWHLDDMSYDPPKRLLAWQTNQSGNDAYFTVDGMVVKVTGPPVEFKAMQVVANADGPLDPPEAGAFGFAGFPTGGVDETGAPLDPTTRQQVGGGRWGFHTADNGGSCGGGTRGSYDAFLSRATKDGANFAAINSYDWEIRFTGSNSEPGVNGGWAREFINIDSAFWVPFELWNIGIGTPDDPSDDYRLIPFVIDDGGDNTFDLESWGCINDTNPVRFGGDGEHSVSSGDNDPFTDWIYWYNPVDITPGQAGYNQVATFLEAQNLDSADFYVNDEILSRTVLVEWNGHTLDNDTLTIPPVFVQDMCEVGTIFRFSTTKPNFPADTFYFTPQAFTLTTDAAELDKIKVVPNPFYLFGGYDPAAGKYEMRFTHLPAVCDIMIYTLGGDLIRTIRKNDASTSTASWDVQTETGLPVASGIYIYVVDAPGYGTKVGKMAVFTEAEVLDLF